MSRLSRRRIDLAVGALIAVVVLVAGMVIWVKSDARATTLVAGAEALAPAPLAEPPTALDQVWELSTSPEFEAVASPYGTVVTADDHTVTGHDAVTGETRWSYTRTNVPLCALGTGDTKADSITASGAVRGIVTGYVKSGHCSEITSLNPITGERLDQRTGFTAADSTLVFGGPYGGMVSSDLVELWRYDLVRTIQYGNQPEPTKPNTKHLGCEFTDIALSSNQFGTIEHCADTGPNAQLVLNFADPGANADGKTKGWDYLNYDPRATVDLNTEHARLLAVTSEEAAVLVETPEPAVVVYDASGTEKSRSTVDIPRDEIVDTDAQGPVTPVVITGEVRYVVVGSTLIAVQTSDLSVRWTFQGALGKPAIAGDDLLVPVDGGLAVVSIATGTQSTVIPVDRAGYLGPVDAAAVGNTVVESRGSTVFGLRDPAAPATDGPPTSTTATEPSGFQFPSRTSSTGGPTSTGP